MINRSEGIQFDSHISHEKIRVKNDEDILKNILNDFFLDISIIVYEKTGVGGGL